MQEEFHAPNYTKKWYNKPNMGKIKASTIQKGAALVSCGANLRLAVCAFAVSVLALSSPAAPDVKPVEWENIDPAHHLAGRMASSGYLRGKVVCLDYRDFGDRSGVAAMRRMEEVWQTFKMKPFVLIGSHRGTAGAEKIRRIAEGLKLTLPIYKEADIVRTEEQKASDPAHIGFMYIIGGTGRILYCGTDDRCAAGVIASALISMRSPTTQKQWRHYIDYYIDYLPGRALLGIEEFRKSFPQEAAAYDEVWEKFSADPDIKRVAKLERLAHMAKDYDLKDPNAKKLSAEKIGLAIEKASDLKKSGNPLVAQEAKNCIADLTWTLAVLSPAGEDSATKGGKQ